jgi:hypothetical protein
MPTCRHEIRRCARKTLVRHCACVMMVGLVVGIVTLNNTTNENNSLRKGGNRRLDTDVIRTGWSKSALCPCDESSPCRDFDTLTCHAKTNVDGEATCTAQDRGVWTLELTMQRWKEKAMSSERPCYCPARTEDLSNICLNTDTVNAWWTEFITQSSFGNNETLADILNQYVGALTLGGSKVPTAVPTLAPTAPTATPTSGPPTDAPTKVPTQTPTPTPTSVPTPVPTPPLLEQCPFLTPISSSEAVTSLHMLCADGTKHSIRQNASFCSGHGGRTKCPRDLPTMCAETKCAGGTDYCCSSEMCRDYGGPRACAAEVGRTYTSAGRGYCRGAGDTHAEQSTVFVGATLFMCRLSCSTFPRCIGFAHAALTSKCVLYYTGNSTDTHPIGQWTRQPEPASGVTATVLQGTTVSQGSNFAGSDHDCFIAESR